MCSCYDVNKGLSEWLMASYLYYRTHMQSPLSDTQFNLLSLYLIDNYDKITHPHKHLVDKEALSCQTGFDIEYPTIVRICAEEWATGV